MFGLSKDDVIQIVRDEVALMEDRLLKNQLSADAEFAGHLNEKVKEVSSQTVYIAAEIKKDVAEIKKELTEQLVALINRANAQESACALIESNMQTSAKSSSDNFDAYLQRLVKLGTAVERVVGITEAGEVTRTELVKQVVKNAEVAKTHTHEIMARFETTMAKISSIFDEQMNLNNQMLAAVKVVAKNFADTMVVIDEEEPEVAPKKKKASKK